MAAYSAEIREKCQICSKNTHIADECYYLSSACKIANCKGIWYLSKSSTKANPGRKFLKCPLCLDFQRLDVAIYEGEHESSSSKIRSEGCFTCGDLGHWKQQCTWTKATCPKPNCGGKRDVMVSKRSHSYGRRFLQCRKCNNAFQWLNEASEHGDNRSELEIPVQIVVNTTLEKLCKTFGKDLAM